MKPISLRKLFALGLILLAISGSAEPAASSQFFKRLGKQLEQQAKNAQRRNNNQNSRPSPGGTSYGRVRNYPENPKDEKYTDLSSEDYHRIERIKLSSLSGIESSIGQTYVNLLLTFIP